MAKSFEIISFSLPTMGISLSRMKPTLETHQQNQSKQVYDPNNAAEQSWQLIKWKNLTRSEMSKFTVNTENR